MLFADIRSCMPRCARSLVPLVVMLLLSCAAHAGAQVVGATPTGATLTGVVQDESGAAVPGVTLRLSDDARGVQRTAVSDPNGSYVFAGIPAGTYVLTSGSGAFAPVRLTGITLADGDRRSLTVTLKMAALQETVSVEGARGYTAGAVTIGKSAESVRQIPQSVSVVTRQRMNDQNLLSLEDALNQTTGVTVIAEGPGSGPIYARGFQVDTFQFDGVPQVDPGHSFSKPDLALYERVEVLRGSAGLLQGSGNPAAAINLVRKRPTRAFAASGTAYAGSWNNYRVDLDLGGPLTPSGRLRGRAVATYEDRESFIDVAESRKHVLYGIAEFDLTSKTLLTGGLQRQRYDAVPFTRGLPRYSDGGTLPLPRSSYLAPAWNDWMVEQTQVFASVEHQWSRDWKFKASVDRAWITWDAKRTFTAGTEGSTLGVSRATHAGRITGAVRHDDTDRLGVDGNVNGAFSLFGRSHTALAGMNARRFRSLGLDGANLPAFAIGNVLDFDPRSIPEPANPPFIGETLYDPFEYGIYGSTRLRLAAPVSLVLGGRVDWYDLVVESRRYATGVTTIFTDERLNGHVTPYAGLVWDLGQTWSAYASYTSIFQPQLSEYTRNGTPIDPIEGRSYEAGLKGEWRRGAVNASAAWFRIDQANRAQQDPTQPCDTAIQASWCYVAEGQVRSQGAETEVSGEWRGLRLFAGYTYNTTTYHRDAANQGMVFMTLMPRHLLRVWTNYQFPSAGGRFSAGAGVTAQGRFYQQVGAIRAEQGAYALVNARLGYRVNERVSIALNGNNLFDRTYFVGVGVSSANLYGDPRNVTLTLRTGF